MEELYKYSYFNIFFYQDIYESDLIASRNIIRDNILEHDNI